MWEKATTTLCKAFNIAGSRIRYSERTRSVEMAKTNTAFASAAKTATTAPKASNTTTVTRSGSVYLSVRDVVLGPRSCPTKSDNAGSADKK